MLFLMVLLVFTSSTAGDNVGSVIFYKRSSKDCWNRDDLAKLIARKIFENVILPPLPPEHINSKNTREALKYYRRALRVVDHDKDSRTGVILKLALADTIGGHLRNDILPKTRFAYYAGFVPHKHVKQLHNLFESIKEHLNTQGQGWSMPLIIPLQTNLTVGKILIGAGTPFDPCSYLVLKRDARKCIHVPTPKVDDETLPTALALPFTSGGFVSLVATSSENILLKYYTTAARCILSSSPKECRHADFVTFNNELWHWMKRYVAPHLMDEKLYTAYGGVLRVAAAVQTYGKGLSRRNLYDTSESIPEVSEWNPWKMLTETQFYLNCDWTPQLYIALILGAAIAICCMQSCYTVVFGRARGCHCLTRRTPSRMPDKEISYAKVDSHFPSMLPTPSRVSALTNSMKRKSLARSKSESVGTAKTQRVYDFNENTEKIMSVIVSDDQATDISMSSTSRDSDIETATGHTLVDSVHTQTIKPQSPPVKPRSPPKIEAAIAQLKIENSPQGQSVRSRPMYSTSTVTHSEVTYCGQPSDTAWSASYSSENSASSDSTKSQSRASRRSRDLAWARRVASKHSARERDPRLRSATGTELDLQSYTTPPSRR